MNLQKNNLNNSKSEVLLKSLKNKSKSSKIIVIGCEDLNFLLELNKEGYNNVYAVDSDSININNCKEKNLEKVFLMDCYKISFEENYFDIIISLYSLETLEFDCLALENWKKLLKTNGELYVIASAFNYLKNNIQDRNKIFRRYTLFDLKEKVISVGYEIEKESYLDFLLYFPTSILRLIELFRLRLFKTEAKKINKVFYLNQKISRIENFVFNKLSLPVGLSVFIKAKKVD